MGDKEQKVFDFDIVLENGLVVFRLRGDADSMTTDSVFDRINAETELYNKIVLNMDHLTYCNSRFLGQLFSFAETISKKQGKTCILGINNQIYETLTIVGMFDVIPNMDNHEEAKKYLTGK